MTTILMTETQQTVLTHAIEHTQGRIEWFPDNVRGGIKTRVLQCLLNNGLASNDGQNWMVTPVAYQVLNIEQPQQVEEAESQDKPLFRAGSKLATVLDLLQRPEGTTIEQVIEATGWQSHTVRGTFAGILKRKGVVITSDKPEKGDRIYRAS
ncbi:DUF3489 domain-containing protein [Orrella sp. 11846]|uniref:DUF3489 domain-containing protein n=1 Tax=Orrella sp. 11846 TaxID=3409913 RepID=UPI003B5B4C2D